METETAPAQPTPEIVDAILSKNNFNANEKIYNALYGKSAEYITARKAQIAKTMFNGPDQEQPDVEAYDEIEPIVQVDDGEEPDSEEDETTEEG